MLKNLIKLLFFCCLPLHLLGQINLENYRLSIKKTQESIKIDGILDETTWKDAEVAKDFFMITPKIF